MSIPFALIYPAHELLALFDIRVSDHLAFLFIILTLKILNRFFDVIHVRVIKELPDTMWNM
jgi:hypothetical protein